MGRWIWDIDWSSDVDDRNMENVLGQVRKNLEFAFRSNEEPTVDYESSSNKSKACQALVNISFQSSRKPAN